MSRSFKPRKNYAIRQSQAALVKFGAKVNDDTTRAYAQLIGSRESQLVKKIKHISAQLPDMFYKPGKKSFSGVIPSEFARRHIGSIVIGQRGVTQDSVDASLMAMLGSKFQVAGLNQAEGPYAQSALAGFFQNDDMAGLRAYIASNGYPRDVGGQAVERAIEQILGSVDEGGIQFPRDPLSRSDAALGGDEKLVFDKLVQVYKTAHNNYKIGDNAISYQMVTGNPSSHQSFVLYDFKPKDLVGFAEGIAESYSWYRDNDYQLVADSITLVIDAPQTKGAFDIVSGKGIDAWQEIQMAWAQEKSHMALFVDYDEQALLQFGLISPEDLKMNLKTGDAKVKARDSFMASYNFVKTFKPSSADFDLKELVESQMRLFRDIWSNSYEKLFHGGEQLSEAQIRDAIIAEYKKQRDQTITGFSSPKVKIPWMQFVNRIFLIHHDNGKQMDVKFSLKTKPIFRRVYKNYPLSLPKAKALHMTVAQGWSDLSEIPAGGVFGADDKQWVNKYNTYLEGRQNVSGALASYGNSWKVANINDLKWIFDANNKFKSSQILSLSRTQVVSILRHHYYEDQYRIAMESQYGATAVRFLQFFSVIGGLEGAKFKMAGLNDLAVAAKKAFKYLEMSRTPDMIVEAMGMVNNYSSKWPGGAAVVFDKLRSWAIKARSKIADEDIKAWVQKVGFTNMNWGADGSLSTTWEPEMPTPVNQDVRAQITLMKSRFSSFVKSFRRTQKKSGASAFAVDAFLDALFVTGATFNGVIDDVAMPSAFSRSSNLSLPDARPKVVAQVLKGTYEPLGPVNDGGKPMNLRSMYGAPQTTRERREVADYYTANQTRPVENYDVLELDWQTVTRFVNYRKNPRNSGVAYPQFAGVFSKNSLKTVRSSLPQSEQSSSFRIVPVGIADMVYQQNGWADSAVGEMKKIIELVDLIYAVMYVMYAAKAYSGVRDYEVYATLMQFRSYRQHLVQLHPPHNWVSTFDKLLEQEPIQYRKNTTRQEKNRLGVGLSTTSYQLMNRSKVIPDKTQGDKFETLFGRSARNRAQQARDGDVEMIPGGGEDVREADVQAYYEDAILQEEDEENLLSDDGEQQDVDSVALLPDRHWISFWERFIKALQYSYERRGVAFKDVIYFPMSYETRWDSKNTLDAELDAHGSIADRFDMLKHKIRLAVGRDTNLVTDRPDDSEGTWYKNFSTLEAEYLYMLRLGQRRERGPSEALPEDFQGYTEEVIENIRRKVRQAKEQLMALESQEGQFRYLQSLIRFAQEEDDLWSIGQMPGKIKEYRLLNFERRMISGNAVQALYLTSQWLNGGVLFVNLGGLSQYTQGMRRPETWDQRIGFSVPLELVHWMRYAFVRDLRYAYVNPVVSIGARLEIPRLTYEQFFQAFSAVHDDWRDKAKADDMWVKVRSFATWIQDQEELPPVGYRSQVDKEFYLSGPDWRPAISKRFPSSVFTLTVKKLRPIVLEEERKKAVGALLQLEATARSEQLLVRKADYPVTVVNLKRGWLLMYAAEWVLLWLHRKVTGEDQRDHKRRDSSKIHYTNPTVFGTIWSRSSYWGRWVCFTMLDEYVSKRWLPGHHVYMPVPHVSRAELQNYQAMVATFYVAKHPEGMLDVHSRLARNANKLISSRGGLLAALYQSIEMVLNILIAELDAELDDTQYAGVAAEIMGQIPEYRPVPPPIDEPGFRFLLPLEGLAHQFLGALMRPLMLLILQYEQRDDEEYTLAVLYLLRAVFAWLEVSLQDRAQSFSMVAALIHFSSATTYTDEKPWIRYKDLTTVNWYQIKSTNKYILAYILKLHGDAENEPLAKLAPYLQSGFIPNWGADFTEWSAMSGLIQPQQTVKYLYAEYSVRQEMTALPDQIDRIRKQRGSGFKGFPLSIYIPALAFHRKLTENDVFGEGALTKVQKKLTKVFGKGKVLKLAPHLDKKERMGPASRRKLKKLFREHAAEVDEGDPGVSVKRALTVSLDVLDTMVSGLPPDVVLKKEKIVSDMIDELVKLYTGEQQSAGAVQGGGVQLPDNQQDNVMEESKDDRGRSLEESKEETKAPEAGRRANVVEDTVNEVFEEQIDTRSKRRWGKPDADFFKGLELERKRPKREE